MSTLPQRIADLVVAIAAVDKAQNTFINNGAANLDALATLTKTDLVSAINELKAQADGVIDDDSISYTEAWSSLKTVTELETATAALLEVTQLKKKWRGCGQSMFAFAELFQSTVMMSAAVRSRHVFPIDVRRFRAVYAHFNVYQLSTPTRVQDVIWGSSDDTGGGAGTGVLRRDMGIQLGFEYPFVESMTGLAPRPAVTFGGQNYLQYTYAVSSTTGIGVSYSISDIYDVGQTIPKGTPFGLHSSIQTAATATQNSTLPTNFKGHNCYANRYEGYVTQNTPIITGKGGSTDVALTATSYTPFASTLGFGSDVGVTPSFLLVETDEGVWEQITVVGTGDSTMRKVGEGMGALPSTTGPYRGDVRGSADGNGGWPERLVVERYGYPFVNGGKSQDGFKYLGLDPEYAKHRIALFAAANPTHILCNNNINDLAVAAALTPTAWTGNTVFATRGKLISNGTSRYVLEKPGTTAATLGPTTKQLRTKDGTCVWRYIGENSTEETIKAFAASYFMRLRDAMPNVPIIQSTPSAQSSSTNFFIDLVNQTAQGNYGDNTSLAGRLATLIRTGKFGADGHIELGHAGAENGFSLSGDVATQTGKWNVPAGAAYTLTGSISGATSANLSTPWAGETNDCWVITFSDGTTIKKVTLTKGSAAVSWTGAVTSTASITITQGHQRTTDGGHSTSYANDEIAQGVRGNVFLMKTAA